MQRYTKPEEFSGLVVSKFIDTSRRMAPRVTLSDGSSVTIYAYTGWDYLNVGDSISKKAGNLEHVIRPKGGIPKSFYPECDGNIIK